MTWEEMEGLERAESGQCFVGRRRPTYKMVPGDFVIWTLLPEARLERNDQLTPTKGVLRTLCTKNRSKTCS